MPGTSRVPQPTQRCCHCSHRVAARWCTRPHAGAPHPAGDECRSNTNIQALRQHQLVQATVPVHCLEMLSVVLPHLSLDATQPGPSLTAPSMSESMPQHAPESSPRPTARIPPGTARCTTPQGQQWLQELGLLDTPPPTQRHQGPVSPALCITPPHRIVRGAPPGQTRQQTDDFGVPLDLISELEDAPRHPWEVVRTPPSTMSRATPMGPLGSNSAQVMLQTAHRPPNFEQYAMPNSAGCVHGWFTHGTSQGGTIPLIRRGDLPWAAKRTTAPRRARTPAWLQRMRRRRR